MKVIVRPLDEVFVSIDCPESVSRELNDFFSFRPASYKYDKRFRQGFWDGYIRLFSTKRKTLYKGLIPYVQDYCKNNDLEFEDLATESDDNFSLKECVDFVKSLHLPSNITPRDYQIKALTHCVRKRRSVILSPTASGKSLIIYSLIRYLGLKTLLIVPQISLVNQMYSDFASYSKHDGNWNASDECSMIMGGSDKEDLNNITISTWQSIFKMPASWFTQFDCVIVDEAHQAKAASLKSIMEKMNRCNYRFAFTGTLDGVEVNKLTIEGLFGLAKRYVETKDLMERGQVSNLKIKCLLLKYSDETKKKIPKEYKDEVNWLIENQRRNKFIANLALSLKGITLVLYQFVEKHGDVLYDMIKDGNPNTVYIHGGVDGSERERIRQMVMNSTDDIPMVCSFGTFSQGVNLPRINNIIFSSPSKSRVRVLQSIGRGLRLFEGKDYCTLFDLSDDLTYNGNQNFTLRHFYERLKIYNSEQFEYKVYNIDLEKEKS